MNLNKFSDATKINVVGLGRSGQHGIVNWLFQQFDCSLFLNNYHHPHTYDAVWFQREKMLGAFKGDIGIKPSVLGFGLEGSIDRANSSSNVSVIVLRDIKNHVASLVKHPTLKPDWDEFFEEWIKYAKHSIGEYPLLGRQTVCISFPYWATSQYYREDHMNFIETKLGIAIEYTDKGKQSVMASGGGSSFDKRKFDGEAHKMDVNNRWKSVKLPPISSEVLDLNDKIFPEIYEWRG